MENMENNQIDIQENYIYGLSQSLLEILLKDQTTKRNIIWATDNYAGKGRGYRSDAPIKVTMITGRNGRTIKPRIEKSKRELRMRTREKAEVFTPSWICNAQNNLVDSQWFGRENVFNKEVCKGWKTNKKKIVFPQDKTWQDYVLAERLEISCGEAPYLVSRYDTVTGEIIPVKDRIGLLDRKLRVVSENNDSEPDWMDWATQAIQSVYGYDWQGDNVLLARENLLFTFIDYYIDKFGLAPMNEYLLEIAKIISWNIWQMDGLKCVVPNTCKQEQVIQMSMFEDDIQSTVCEGCRTNNIRKHNGIYCKIKDWKKNKIIKFVDMIEGD